ncbi:cobalt-precorrin-6A reductase [Aestuariivirga sp.]|uniref:cobalt-precorrin-6A reductase n=1 Tax=Aestuariivirga sp. TaxID=2650926 RepID=UPI003BA8A9EB
MQTNRVLILGGTGDARGIAAELVGAGRDVITSLAGVTEQPLWPAGEVRRGGFGGVEGLRQFLVEEGIALVIDATHPFAARMSAQAVEACAGENVPLLRFERPAWKVEAGDRWISASSIGEAALLLPPNARVFLTIGRTELAQFFARSDLSGVARMIEPPPMDVPPQWEVLRQRPPFAEASEAELLVRHGISHVVSKNAGGDATEAKLTAARRLGLQVVMIGRPAKPAAPRFSARADLIRHVERLLSP